MNYCGKGELESYIFFNIYFEFERRDAMEPTFVKLLQSALTLIDKGAVVSLKSRRRQRRNEFLIACMGQLQSLVHRRRIQLDSFPDLSNFPPEVAVCVLSHLNATDLCLAACVWQHLADNELLWQR